MNRSIALGTCIRRAAWRDDLRAAASAGFSCVELYCPEGLQGLDLLEAGRAVADAGPRVSAIGVYGNPLTSEETRTELERCID